MELQKRLHQTKKVEGATEQEAPSAPAPQDLHTPALERAVKDLEGLLAQDTRPGATRNVGAASELLIELLNQPWVGDENLNAEPYKGKIPLRQRDALHHKLSTWVAAELSEWRRVDQQVLACERLTKLPTHFSALYEQGHDLGVFTGCCVHKGELLVIQSGQLFPWSKVEPVILSDGFQINTSTPVRPTRNEAIQRGEKLVKQPFLKNQLCSGAKALFGKGAEPLIGETVKAVIAGLAVGALTGSVTPLIVAGGVLWLGSIATAAICDP